MDGICLYTGDVDVIWLGNHLEDFSLAIREEYIVLFIGFKEVMSCRSVEDSFRT